MGIAWLSRGGILQMFPTRIVITLFTLASCAAHTDAELTFYDSRNDSTLDLVCWCECPPDLVL